MDDLTRINGIGPTTAKRLTELGFDSFEKLAAIGDGENDPLGRDVVRPEWIVEATRFHHENTQEKPPRSDDEEGTVDGAPADSGTGDPHTDTQENSGTAREASSTDSGTTAETPSVGVQPGSQPDASQGDLSGAGNPAGPAGALAIAPDHPDRQEFPLTFAALEAWQAANPGKWPAIVRISSKRPGFRRANMDHPKGPTDHPAGRFDMRDMERLLAEPVLTVEWV